MSESDNFSAMPEQARVSIGVAARLTGVSANTLRMWERRYQLGPSKRSKGGQREYTQTDIDHLKLIKQLLDNGTRIGDIAQLSTQHLSTLLMEIAGKGADVTARATLTSVVVGAEVGRYFKSHIKRYPNLEIFFSSRDAESWLESPEMDGKKLLVIQLNSINRKHVSQLRQVMEAKVHVIVLYIYANQSSLQELEQLGAILLPGRPEATYIDDAIQKVHRFVEHTSPLEKNSEAFDISLPDVQPAQFSESELLDAEALTSKLNCECPAHLTDLIRRLSAFEEYSKTCGAENWKQAAVHTCIYAYANKARYLMEKALLAVLEE